MQHVVFQINLLNYFVSFVISLLRLLNTSLFFSVVEEDVGLSVGAAWIAGQDRSMWRTLRPSAGQAQQ